MEFTYNEISSSLKIKHVGEKTTTDTSTPAIFEVRDLGLMSKPIFPKEVKVNFTNDDIRLT